jgi:hypothetical protein
VFNNPAQQQLASNNYIKGLMNTCNFAVASAPEGER